MARVTEFFQVRGDTKPHPTEVECGYRTINTPTGPLLQLSTYGSDERQSEKKVSQTLQLDRENALRLVAIIRETFPDL
ncbi:hypothetical protein AORI_0307 [Amycolatopsis keratiniphila]|uniref:Uncharacterized protein n=1 Tax=Amycolatopsis keratiniphila TaxID=129921 RepID=R4SRW4_9PSEU|nr:hypothetical protein AORI_0307 [Amycolatopsis keratiniphila]